MALTIKRQGVPRYGTPQSPLPLEIDMGRVLDVRPAIAEFVLGFEGIPASTCYVIECASRCELLVNRRGGPVAVPRGMSPGAAIRPALEDRYLNCVEVSLLDGTTRRRLATLTNAKGDGITQILQPGRYLIVASLGIAENVPVRLEVYGGRAPSYFSCEGVLTMGGQCDLGGTLLSGEGTLELGGEATVNTGLLMATGTLSVGGEMALSEIDSMELRAAMQVNTSMTIAPFRWIDVRGRILGPDIIVIPLNYDRVIERRADFDLVVRFSDVDENPLDLSGLTPVIEAWDERRFIRYAIFTPDLSEMENGFVIGRLSDTQTLTMPDLFYIDIRLDNGSGGSTYPLQGVWTVSEGYTA